MKKLLSLLMAMMLLLPLISGCAQQEPPAETGTDSAPAAEASGAETAADDPAAAAPAAGPIATPVLYTDYQAQLEAVYAGSEIVWQPLIGEESLIMVALLNGTAPCVYLQVSDGYIQQLAVEMTGSMTEQSIMTFVSLSTYATSALLAMNGTAPADAIQPTLAEVYGMFNANLTGTPVNTVFGIPSSFNLIPASETTCTFYYMLDLTAPQAGA